MLADFSRYVPPAAVTYCSDLQRIHRFQFQVSRPRRSKWGDYRYRRQGQTETHLITVNADLNGYAFLITYLHEVAHLTAFRQHGFDIRPHGSEWKYAFRCLLQPMMKRSVFPDDLLAAFDHYINNPRAAVGAHPLLTTALQRHGHNQTGTRLSSIPPGDFFQFQGRTFQKVKVRRTRSLCKETITKKNYLILETTLVDPVIY